MAQKSNKSSSQSKGRNTGPSRDEDGKFKSKQSSGKSRS